MDTEQLRKDWATWRIANPELAREIDNTFTAGAIREPWRTCINWLATAISAALPSYDREEVLTALATID